MSSTFDRIRAGLEDAIAASRGDARAARARAVRVVDVADLRRQLGMTQVDFAAFCCVSVGTIRNWEQGRRAPTGPALTMLRLVELNPKSAAALARQTG